MKRYLPIILICFAFLLFSAQISDAYAQDLKTLSKHLMIDYKGRIISIEQLNSSTCRAVLSSDVSNLKCVKIAENIGYSIRNSTGGIRGERTSVHVFKGGKQVAIARPSGMPSGMQYEGLNIGRLRDANSDPVQRAGFSILEIKQTLSV